MPTDSSPSADGDAGRFQLASGMLLGGGRYTLIRFLGRGGMGVVWLASDARLGEEVALKFLPPEIPGDPVALDDMRRETAKSRKLSHPHIIRIHDFYEGEGEAFVSMEFVDGPNLSALRLEQENSIFRWDVLVPVITQLCQALDYAHHERIIHRDLKPANMMLDSKGRLKLADFGIAAVVDEAAGRISVKHAKGGTLGYMSPQQLDGELPRVTDDIYAVGATLYELLTGKPPFYSGDVTHQVRTLAATPVQDRLDEFGLQNEIPLAVMAMIMACLSKNSEQRPQSARAIAEWIGLETEGLSASQGENLLAASGGRQALICGVCGHNNFTHATFCNKCGQILVALALPVYQRAFIYLGHFVVFTLAGGVLGLMAGAIYWNVFQHNSALTVVQYAIYAAGGALFADYFGWLTARREIKRVATKRLVEQAGTAGGSGGMSQGLGWLSQAVLILILTAILFGAIYNWIGAGLRATDSQAPQASQVPAPVRNKRTSVAENHPPPVSQSVVAASLPKLVLNFDFDEAAGNGVVLDQSGHGNNGRIQGARPTNLGLRDNGMNFSPNNCYITVPNNDSLNSTQLTLSVWINTSLKDHFWRRILDKSYRNGFALSIAGDWEKWNPQSRNRGFVAFEIGSKLALSDTSVADGHWHHVAATYDGKEMRLFIDGRSQARPVPRLGVVPKNNFDLHIGGFVDPDLSHDDPTASFSGSLDEMKIFDRALSAEEVRQLFESSKGASSSANVPGQPR